MTARRLSDEHRVKISAAVRAGWSEERRAKLSASTSASMTPERRAQIAEQMRAYHARIRERGANG